MKTKIFSCTIFSYKNETRNTMSINTNINIVLALLILILLIY